jgi:hypothetical protein
MCPTATTSQQSAIEKTALFIGGSNADRLANSAATLGINPETVTSGGWILSTANVTTILPEVEAYCNTMPADSPVIIYCLDNSSFACKNQDTAISAIRKLDKGKDNSYHVVGELIVAHKITLAAAVSNLKRIIAVCGGRLVIIVTLLPRYLNGRCCEDVDHAPTSASLSLGRKSSTTFAVCTPSSPADSAPPPTVRWLLQVTSYSTKGRPTWTRLWRPTTTSGALSTGTRLLTPGWPWA